MNIIELKETSTNKIDNFLLRPITNTDFYELHINSEYQGKLNRSDLRHFIEILDSNTLENPEMLLNGVKSGYINNTGLLVKYIDGIIHKCV